MFTIFERRRRFLRFNLQALFLGVAVVAVAMAWLVAQRKWIDERREAREWANPRPDWSFAQTSSRERLPIGLRILGERAMEFFVINAAGLSPSEHYRIQQFRDLFPEAEIRVVWRKRTPITMYGAVRDWFRSRAIDARSWVIDLFDDVQPLMVVGSEQL